MPDLVKRIDDTGDDEQDFVVIGGGTVTSGGDFVLKLSHLMPFISVGDTEPAPDTTLFWFPKATT